MASKYAGLKGRIPEQPTEREAAVQALLDEYKDTPIADLTATYNLAVEQATSLAAKVKAIGARLEAFEILIRQRLDALEGDAISVNGYTWSPKFEPYPVAEDVDKIVAYFKEHGMEDQLVLKTSELASRLKNFVKEEALNGELIVEPKTVVDEATGEEKVVNDVRSQIPGVRVFLKASLSRVKTKGAK